ncbi:MAG TPA: Ig-like domain-containing protein, partial [Bacillota bacterium]|nr:Ig-like domain-containing protein [Bacillota bacterium]
MKTIRSVLGPLATGSLFTLITLASVCGSLAQILNPPIDPTVPVVSLRATDPNASWAGDAGVVTVFRDGPTNASLNLYYRIGGTAINGVDYGQLANWISIAAGERTNRITIKPIDAGQSVSKTVELVLTYPPTMPPINYQIGLASNALVTIRSAAPTNLPPVVSILSPTNGAVFPLGADILMCADARDAEGYVSTVEFFAGTRSLGIRTNNPASAGPMNPFCLVWSNAPAGAYVLTARATDNAGASSVSPPVRVQVSWPPPLPLVSVLATDPNATEPGALAFIDPGAFTIVRNQGTNEPMQVLYSLRGTASNGVDYVLLSNSVVIPAGALSARVAVNPLMDRLVEGTETVVLRLEPVVCAAIFPPPPGCYQVGAPSEAVVFIADSSAPPTNLPPLVRISSPPNNAIFRAPVSIPLFAYARDGENAVATVEFFAGTNSLGYGQPITTSNALAVAAAYPSNSCVLFWSNAPLGAYTLTAKATDKQGASSISEPV